MPAVLRSLTDDPAGPAEVVLVDNSASEVGRELAETYGLKLVAREGGGFADGCDEGALASTQPVVVLLGHDTVPNRGWLPPLVDALELEGVGAAMATMEDGSTPGTFNTSGGYLTFLGLAWVSDQGQPIPDESQPITVDFPSGGAMAMRRDVWDRFEGFRREYFIYQEDSDLGWRLRLANLHTVRVPGSRVVHEYEFGRQPNKMFLLERNRLITVLSNYQKSTLLLLAPALLAAELGIVVVAIRDGWFKEKLRSYWSVWRNRSWISAGRALTDRNRKIGDAEMMATMGHKISSMPEIKSPNGVRGADWFFGTYLRFVTPVVSFVERL